MITASVILVIIVYIFTFSWAKISSRESRREEQEELKQNNVKIHNGKWK